MKMLILFSSLAVFLFGFLKIRLNQQQTTANIELKRENIYSCSPYLNGNTEAGEDSKFITELPGWGKYSYSISTKNDSAQFYFNQGLSMYYSYHWREANASFKEAARFDPGSAIAYWGQALALGSGYNFSLH
jgi:hypothetical protein